MASRQKSRRAAGKTGAPSSSFLGWVSRIVQMHRRRLVQVAVREGVREVDAFDCVQEAFFTFLDLRQARTLSEHSTDALKLLTIVVRNEARNVRRKHAVAKPHGSDDSLASLATDLPSVDSLLETAEQQLRLVGCLHLLRDIQRSVVTLRLLEDVSGNDVAKRLGLSPGHVAVLLARAKQNLRRCMA